MSVKKLFFDLETTGTDPGRHAIHQLSAIIDIDGEVKETIDLRVRPHQTAELDPAALAISGVTPDVIAEYREGQHVYAELVQTLSEYVDKYNKADKFHLVGYNNRGFDDRFLREFWGRWGNYYGSWFWADSIDVMVLASNSFIELRPQLQDFKLKTVARFAGLTIDESRLHDAAYDIQLTRELYYKLR